MACVTPGRRAGSHDRPAERRPDGSERRLRAAAARLSIRDLSITFSGLRAMDHVSFDVPTGGVTAVIGPNGVVMRGVLLDVARHLGRDSLEPGHAISPEELDATAEAQGVEIRRGDAVIVRTGLLEARRQVWGDYAGGPAPGLSLHVAPWLHAHDVAAVATDTWRCEARPNEIDLFQPLHVVALVHMGIPFGEIWGLQAIGEDCAADGVYEFMLSAAPLPISGGAGSPVNALAIK